MKTTQATEGEEKGREKKSAKSFFLMLSATLFGLVCAVSAFLVFENSRFASSIEANRSEIASYDSSIEKIKSDKKIIAAELVANNKSEIVRAIQISEAQKYISELQDVSRKYKIMFSGFSYENGKIATSAVSIPETILSGSDGVGKISGLIKDYRTATGSIFKLSPVLSVSGYEQKRNFSVEFNVAGASQK